MTLDTASILLLRDLNCGKGVMAEKDHRVDACAKYTLMVQTRWWWGDDKMRYYDAMFMAA